MDWDKMKGTDTQAQEELEQHKRSSNKYLDKVRPTAGEGRPCEGGRCLWD